MRGKGLGWSGSVLQLLVWFVSLSASCQGMEQQQTVSGRSATDPWNMPGAYGVGDTNGSVNGAFDVYIKYPVAGYVQSRSDWPVVLFFNGFQSRYSWYSTLLDAVSSWGFVTVQYQLPAMSLMSVEAELQTYYKPLIAWIETGGLQKILDTMPGMIVTADLTSIFSAGHSRGGKVASLVFTEDDDRLIPLIKAAFLIDPVDSSGFAPISAENPSAITSLKASGKSISVAGASIVGSCNPAQGNYEKFFDAGSTGSWKIVMNGTSHSQFAIAGGLADTLSDSLCGSGTSSRRDIANTVASSMVSWFTENGNQTANTGQVVQNFYAGIMQQVEFGNVQSFSLKGSSECAFG